MMEFLSMGGYAAYVWSSYILTLAVLCLNLIISHKRHKSVLRRLRRLHEAAGPARDGDA